MPTLKQYPVVFTKRLHDKVDILPLGTSIGCVCITKVSRVEPSTWVLLVSTRARREKPVNRDISFGNTESI